jgi:hypothetical protein
MFIQKFAKEITVGEILCKGVGLCERWKVERDMGRDCEGRESAALALP